MVSMLGFSDEDKQKIGMVQQGSGKGVVHGVLDLPGRLVGEILGGSSTESTTNAGSDDQSFADLWVDFLLKETKEREKRESSRIRKYRIASTHIALSSIFSALKCSLFFVPVHTENLLSSDLQQSGCIEECLLRRKNWMCAEDSSFNSISISDTINQKEDLTLALGSVYAWTDWTSIRFSAYRDFLFLSDLAIA
ncbi:hypothetical protein RJT34_24647 [Clitoria ternatea]|uniref:Uncharacterized protein n=1 Tax=Clitoria ternatea TaxID=43366 RepID=A0AAN9II71_CLITE